MSASLVGSEMCIRDRLPSEDMIRVTVGCAWTRNLVTGMLLLARRKGVVAVSYTHLTLPTICSV
eukprot:12533395-Alexandrium_andersonii.AAC.1